MDSIIAFFLDKAPVIAIVLIAFTIGIITAWWAGKFYHKVKHTESEVSDVKTELHEVKVQVAECATKADLESLRVSTKAEIESLRADTKANMTALRSDMEALRADSKADIVSVKAEIESLRISTKSDLDAAVKSLKENDLFHTNKAILILAKLMLSKDKNNEAIATGFEWLRDTVLETTPEQRRDEIKSISL